MEQEFDPASTDPAQWPAGRLLSAASRRVERDWNAHLAAWDLNHASLPVLVHLSRAPLSQRQLAAACGVTEQTTSRVVARMERTGYVTRTPHPGDRRQLVLSITELAYRTKISEATLLAIERNDLKALPGGIYLRGFLRAYAREVGCDPEEIVARYRTQSNEEAESNRLHGQSTPNLTVRCDSIGACIQRSRPRT